MLKFRKLGIRVGEKIYEELLIENELPNAFENDELVVCLGDVSNNVPIERRGYLKNMNPCVDGYNSDKAKLMTREEIITFLQSIGYLKKQK